MAVTFLQGIDVPGTSALSGTVNFSSTVTFSGTTNIQGTPFLAGFINHLGDGDTHFGFPSNDQWRVNVGGTTRLSVNSSGVVLSNVGSAGATGASVAFIDGSNIIKKSTQTLGSNAFNSTTIPTNAVLTSGNQTIAGTKTFSSSTVFPGADGGMEIGLWAQSSSFGFIGTANMTGLEYCLITNGTDTFLGAATGGKLKMRGPANDSSPSIVIDGTSVTVDDGASVGTGAIRAKYKSSDNSAGITTTVGVKNASQSQNLTLTIKDGVITGVSSDRRLKTNITLIGTSDSGINIYTFEYKYKFSIEGVGLFQGVMSDEVPEHAVSVDHHGFDIVDYSVIDVEFKRVSI